MDEFEAKNIEIKKRITILFKKMATLDNRMDKLGLYLENRS